MDLPTACRTPFLFEGRTLYVIDGAPGRLFVQQTYGEVEAAIHSALSWRRFRFTRCPQAELEMERLGWQAPKAIPAVNPVD